jgi:transposase
MNINDRQKEELQKMEEVKTSEILKLRKESKTIEEISQVTGFSRHEVYKTLVKYNVGYFRGGKRKSEFTPEIKIEVLNILKSNPLYGGRMVSSIIETNFNVKIKTSSLCRFMNDNGYRPRLYDKKFTDKVFVNQEVIRTLYKNGMKIQKIAEKLNFCYYTIQRLLKDCNEFKSEKKKIIYDEKFVDRVIKLLSEGNRVNKIAVIMNVDYTSLTNYVVKHDLRKFFIKKVI